MRYGKTLLRVNLPVAFSVAAMQIASTNSGAVTKLIRSQKKKGAEAPWLPEP
jgi:hypothetical protein